MEKELEQLVTEFRTAIENVMAAGDFNSDVFSRFPYACCGDASDLLAQYLLENGIKSKYVCGNRYFDDPEEGTQSHGWLLVNGLIVDITGDQSRDRSSYYNYNQRVYIGAGDAFHDLFEVKEQNIYEFHGIENYEYKCRVRLLGIYKKIKKYCVKK